MRPVVVWIKNCITKNSNSKVQDYTSNIDAKNTVTLIKTDRTHWLFLHDALPLVFSQLVQSKRPVTAHQEDQSNCCRPPAPLLSRYYIISLSKSVNNVPTGQNGQTREI